jgi:hypothetical protein
VGDVVCAGAHEAGEIVPAFWAAKSEDFAAHAEKREKPS